MKPRPRTPPEAVLNAFLLHLQRWPLFEVGYDAVRVHDGEQMAVMYRTRAGWKTQGTTHFDVNIIGDTLYLLEIEIVPEHRGLGHGAALYELLPKIAADVRCAWVRQTPSGWTNTGETRMDYLLRHGWTRDGAEVWKPSFTGAR